MKKTKTQIEKQSFWIILASFPIALITFLWLIITVGLVFAFLTMPLWLPVVLLIHLL